MKNIFISIFYGEEEGSQKIIIYNSILEEFAGSPNKVSVVEQEQSKVKATVIA